MLNQVASHWIRVAPFQKRYLKQQSTVFFSFSRGNYISNFVKPFHEFQSCRALSNSLLRLSPTQNAPSKPKGSSSSQWKSIKNMLPMFWPTNKEDQLRVTGSVACLVLSKVATIQAPLLLANVINTLGVATTAPTIALSLLGGYFLARISMSFFAEVRNALFARVSQRAARNMATKVFSHIHKTDLGYLLNTRVGELSNITTRGVKGSVQLMNMTLFQVVPTMFEFALVVFVLFNQVGSLCTGITLATLASYSLFTTILTGKRTLFRKKMNEAEQRAAGLLTDSLINAEAVRLFSNEDLETKRYDDAMGEYERENIKVLESLAALNFGQQLIFNCGLIGVMGVTAMQVLSGDLQLGSLVLVNSLLFQLAIPLNMIGTMYRETRSAIVDMEKINKLIDTLPQCHDVANAINFIPKKGEIEFKDVYFKYIDKNDTRVIFNQLNFKIAAGEKIGIVGQSGSGKSTIARLLLRFYDVNKGEILIDGQQIKDLKIQSYRQHIGVVPQDVVLFNDTLKYNILYANPSATEEELKRAIKEAQLDSTIQNLPLGIDTVVGERGLKLSGGEKQRVGIARCLLKKSNILILDEATSSLDNHTEKKVLQNFKSVFKNKTCIVVAHRLTSIADSNRIFFLKNGSISECGTHDELLTLDGDYANLWNEQMRDEL